MAATITVPSQLRSRIIAAVLLAMGLGLLGAYISVLLSGTIPPKKTDFITYFSAAYQVIGGHGGSLYDFHALSRIERQVVAPYRLTYGVLPYIYPPYFAVSIAPLGLLDLDRAYLIWGTVDVAILCLALVSVQRRAHLSLPGATILWLAAWTFIPTFIALLQGQVSFLLLALLGGALLCLDREWDLLAGMLLAGAMLKPTYVAPCLVVLIARARWRPILSFLAGTVLLTLVPTLVLGPRINTAYLSTLRRALGWTTQFGYGPEKTASVAGPLRLLLPSGAAFVALAVITALLLIGLGVFSRRSERLSDAFGLAVLIGLLFSPHVLVHDLVLLLIPVAVALARRADGPTWLPVALGVVYVLAVIGLVLAEVLHVQPVILAMCLLGIWIALAHRSPREQPRGT